MDENLVYDHPDSTFDDAEPQANPCTDSCLSYPVAGFDNACERAKTASELSAQEVRENLISLAERDQLRDFYDSAEVELVRAGGNAADLVRLRENMKGVLPNDSESYEKLKHLAERIATIKQKHKGV